MNPETEDEKLKRIFDFFEVKDPETEVYRRRFMLSLKAIELAELVVKETRMDRKMIDFYTNYFTKKLWDEDNKNTV
jgi:hypothetical protein